VLNSLTIGGVEKVVVDICNGLDERGHEVYIVSLFEDNFDTQKNINDNIKVISLPFRSNSIFNIVKFWLFGLPKITKVINGLKPQIVHSHQYYHYYLFLSLSFYFSKIKPAHFRTIHTSGLYYNSKSLIDRIRLTAEKIASKLYPGYLISISKEILENNKKYFSRSAIEIRLIPNGIHLNKFSRLNNFDVKKEDYGIYDNKIIITYVSRLHPGKNHECLIKAWGKVVEVNPAAHLWLVGDGILKGDLIKMAEELKIEKSISFLGVCDDVPKLLSISDIAVFPSQFEGFGLSLIEKMAMQLPIVASDIAFFKEVIVPDVNGILYSVNNSQELTESINQLIKDQFLRERLGKNAHKTAMTYDINVIINATIKFYEESLSI